jgi:hypothetical protein
MTPECMQDDHRSGSGHGPASQARLDVWSWGLKQPQEFHGMFLWEFRFQIASVKGVDYKCPYRKWRTIKKLHQRHLQLYYRSYRSKKLKHKPAGKKWWLPHPSWHASDVAITPRQCPLQSRRLPQVGCADSGAVSHILGSLPEKKVFASEVTGRNHVYICISFV